MGAGPFPTELFDETGEFLCNRVTNSAQLRGVVVVPAGWTRCRSSCGTAELPVWLLPDQADVLDGLKEVKLCVAYRMPDGVK